MAPPPSPAWPSPPPWRRGPTPPLPLPGPGGSGIDHIVVLMMENRSFDHFLGWLPGADGKQAGLSVRRPRRRHAHAPTTSTDYQGCAHPDPDHSFEGGRVAAQRRARATGGCARARTTSSRSATTRRRDLGFYGQAAPYWTTFDRYFSATMAETYPNRFYQHAAQTDRIHNSTDDRDDADDLGPAGRQGRRGTLLLRRRAVPRALGHEVPRHRRTFAAVPRRRRGRHAARRLVRRPAVPRRGRPAPPATTTRTPTSGPAQSFLNQVYEAVTAGPGWEKTAAGRQLRRVGRLLRPRRRRRDGAGRRRRAGTGAARLPVAGADGLAARAAGPRRARRLRPHLGPKMIEWRWGLQPLTPRDAARPQHRRGARLRPTRLTSTADLRRPAVRARPGAPCQAPAAESGRGWADRCASSSRAAGWSLP